MLKIVFKNMTPSALIKEAIQERMIPIYEKFPIIKNHNIVLTVETENSPRISGKDSYSFSSVITGEKIKFMKLKKNSTNVYRAASEVFDNLHEKIDRMCKKINQ